MRDTKPTIFIVEDERKSAIGLCGLLESTNFRVQAFSNAYAVLPIARKTAPALFIIDIGLPGKSGIELCREIRNSTDLYFIPVIFHSANLSESDRLIGLDLGDEYISKPSSPRELVARVKAVLRRFERNARILSMKFGDLEVNCDGMLVRMNGQSVDMTTSEFRLLHHFLQHPRRVFTREELVEALWDNEQYVSLRSVDACVKRLRKKIEPCSAAPQYLQTIRGAGYRFVHNPGASES